MITIETRFNEDEEFNVRLTEKKEVEVAQADSICFDCDHLGFDFDGCEACTRPLSRTDYSVKDERIVKCKHFKKKPATRLLNDFYGDIYIHPEHLCAMKKEFTYGEAARRSLIEEMAELTQASTKYDRLLWDGLGSREDRKEHKSHITEEMAHVLLCIKMVCDYMNIKSEDIQAEIQKKWPEAYERTRT